MKRPFLLLLAAVILLCTVFPAAADSIVIPAKDNFFMKYNSVASTFGGAKIDPKKEMIDGNTSIFQTDTCLIAFYFVDGELTNAGVRTLKNYNPDEFLMTCMTFMTLLGKMDYTAYGHLLHQYSSVLAGKDGSPYMIGLDSFNITIQDDGEFMFLYYNYGLDYWF